LNPVTKRASTVLKLLGASNVVNLDVAEHASYQARTRRELPFVMIRSADRVPARGYTPISVLFGSTLRAPFDGRVSLVNLEIDDPVNDESRVMEIIDPRQVEVAGLVGAIDLPFVQVQASARLQIGSLLGRELFGVATTVGESPPTERGVVSYSIDIAVELPNDVVMPIKPSSVAVVLIYEGPPG